MRSSVVFRCCRRRCRRELEFEGCSWHRSWHKPRWGWSWWRNKQPTGKSIGICRCSWWVHRGWSSFSHSNSSLPQQMTLTGCLWWFECCLLPFHLWLLESLTSSTLKLFCETFNQFLSFEFQFLISAHHSQRFSTKSQPVEQLNLSAAFFGTNCQTSFQALFILIMFLLRDHTKSQKSINRMCFCLFDLLFRLITKPNCFASLFEWKRINNRLLIYSSFNGFGDRFLIVCFQWFRVSRAFDDIVIQLSNTRNELIYLSVGLLLWFRWDMENKNLWRINRNVAESYRLRFRRRVKCRQNVVL